MNSITANEIKTQGIKVIKQALSGQAETIITERGVERFIVVAVERYNQLREYELEAALQESLKEIEKGDYMEESVEEHVKRIKNV